MSDLLDFPPHKHNLRLLSIHSIYLNRIRDGSKTIELRTYNTGLLPGSWCLAYETKPVQQISTVFRCSGFWCLSPQDAWQKHHSILGIDQDPYFEYFANRQCAYGYIIDKVLNFEPLTFDQLKQDLKFTPPQGSPRWNHSRIYGRILDAIKQ